MRFIKFPRVCRCVAEILSQIQGCSDLFVTNKERGLGLQWWSFPQSQDQSSETSVSDIRSPVYKHKLPLTLYWIRIIQCWKISVQRKISLEITMSSATICWAWRIRVDSNDSLGHICFFFFVFLYFCARCFLSVTGLQVKVESSVIKQASQSQTGLIHAGAEECHLSPPWEMTTINSRKKWWLYKCYICTLPTKMDDVQKCSNTSHFSLDLFLDLTHSFSFFSLFSLLYEVPVCGGWLESWWELI